MDTPTLKGVWETGPYLHDGSAPTVMEVLTAANAGDRHGKTSHLSVLEKDNLAAFLLQLDEADRDGHTGLAGRAAVASRAGRLIFLKSPGGRPQGLILEGVPAGLLPKLTLHTLQGAQVLDFRNGNWQISPTGMGRSTGPRYYLPWPSPAGGDAGILPGLYLARASGPAGTLSLKILVNP